MKTLSSNPDIFELAAIWLRDSPFNAAIGCFIMVVACWVISYKLKDLI